MALVGWMGGGMSGIDGVHWFLLGLMGLSLLCMLIVHRRALDFFLWGCVAPFALDGTRFVLFFSGVASFVLSFLVFGQVGWVGIALCLLGRRRFPKFKKWGVLVCLLSLLVNPGMFVMHALGF